MAFHSPLSPWTSLIWDLKTRHDVRTGKYRECSKCHSGIYMGEHYTYHVYVIIETREFCQEYFCAFCA